MKTRPSIKPFENIFKETQSVITILYILAVGVGMLFSYQKYSEFGINIFDYAGVFEFLVAPFADYLILLFTVITFLLAYLLFRLDKLWKTKHPASYKKMNFGWERSGRLLQQTSYAVMVIVYLYIAAGYYGELKREEIFQQPDIELKYQDNSVTSGKLIGVTSNILFLYKVGQVKAIPLTALVKEFEIMQVVIATEGEHALH